MITLSCSCVMKHVITVGYPQVLSCFIIGASYVLYHCIVACYLLVADEPQDPVVAQSAFMLYGMIHARFIVTARGLEAMVSRLTCLTSFGHQQYTMKIISCWHAISQDIVHVLEGWHEPP